MRLRLHRKDLWWIAAYPAYQFLGTIRHEAAHALAAVASGASVTRFVVWPSSGHQLFSPGFWGYVVASGATSWTFFAAPYLGDVATFAVTFLAFRYAAGTRRWLWLNLAIIGLVSPLVNSAYNYALGLLGHGDVAILLHSLRPWIVHGWFASTLVLFAVGIAMVFRMTFSSGYASSRP